MDISTWPAILGAVGVLFGAYATFQQQRAANANERFELLFGFQGKSLEVVQAENADFRTRLTKAEQSLRECQTEKHSQGLEIKDLKYKVTELQRLIPDGTATD